MKHLLVISFVICFVHVSAIAQSVPQNTKAPTNPPAGAKDVDPVPQKTRERFERELQRRLQGSGRGAQAGAPVQTPAAQNTTVNASEDFIIGPEDVLQISVWREPDLTTKAVVRPDGKIGVTLLGDIQASGLTATQLTNVIAGKLTRYVEQPEVSVVVVEIRSQMVHLIGAVARQGAYGLGGPLTVVELLARAGGLTEETRGENIVIVRNTGNTVQRTPFNYRAFVEGRGLQKNIPLKHGDVVIVR